MAEMAQERDPIKSSYRRLAISYMLSGRFLEAKNAIESALRLSPNDPELHHLYARVLFLEGVELEDVSALHQAIQEFDTARSRDSIDPYIQSRYCKYISDTEIKLSEVEQARFWLEKALEHNPKDRDLEWNLILFQHKIYLERRSQDI